MKLKTKLKKIPELVKIDFIVIIVIFAYFFIFSKFHFFAVAKLKTQDAVVQIAHLLRPLPERANDIVVIEIDAASFEKLGKKWPWRRAMFAYLIDRLKPYQPKAIAMDLSFTGESEQKIDDELLIEAMSDAGNVIVATYFSSRGEYLKPWEKVADSVSGYGFINKPRDKDFYIRSTRTIVFSQKGKIIDYSFGLKTLAKYLDASTSAINYDGNNIKIKNMLIPVNKDGTLPINFRVKYNEFQCIPFWRVLKTDLPLDTFKDKIVLVGATNEAVHDIYHTPLGLMPGVIMNANELLMFLARDFIRTIPRWAELLIMCLFVLLVALLTTKEAMPPVFPLTLGLIIIFWTTGIFLFLKNIRLDYFGPAFMMAISYLGISGYKYFKILLENVGLRTIAITDALTGLFSYRYFELRLANELEQARRYGLNLSLAIMDIDHFKKINDTYGHEIGNVVLRQISEALLQKSRKADMLFRYGGEELCAILSHTPKEGALIYSENMRKMIEEMKVPEASELKVTVSFGIASFPEVDAQSTKELINAADTALYQAKNSGRNRSIVFQPEFSSENILSKDR